MGVLAGKDSELVRQFQAQHSALVGPRRQMEGHSTVAWLTSHGLQAAVSIPWSFHSLPFLPAKLKPNSVASAMMLCGVPASPYVFCTAVRSWLESQSPLALSC